MRRFALVPAIALLALACQDQPLPTDGKAPSPSPAASVQAQSAGEIEGLIEELFPGPGLERAALAQFDNVERKIEEGDLEEARAKAFDLIGFTLDKLEAGQLEDPAGSTTTEEAVSELIDLLLTFVGLEAPDVSPSVLSGETDGVVAIASPDQDNLIVTENEFAGTFIQEGAVDEETIVVVERLDPAAQTGGDCLPVGTEQREGCYRFDKTPDDIFNEDVLVAVCPVASLRDENDPDFDERFQLAKFDPDRTELGVVPLPSASEDFLDCSDFGTLAAAGQGALGRLAAAWSATGGRLLGWLGPAPARAVNLGFGGSTRDFSRIGWARLAEVQIASGDGQTDFTGFPVDANPTVQVSPVHGSSNAGLEGLDVTFTVTGGGGSVDDPATSGNDRLNSVTVPTDASGQASVPWRLGDAGANALEASAGVDAVTFSATANAPTLPIQCTGGGGDRVLNQATTATVGRAFYVAGYPDMDLAQVDLWFSADTAVNDDPVSASYTIELTVREGGFGGTVLGTDVVQNVTLSGDRDTFTQASFSFQIDGSITPGSTVTFHPVVTDAPAVEVFMEVPESDQDPQFGLPGDADCPIIETEDATAPLSTDRRQGVRANIFAVPPVIVE